MNSEQNNKEGLPGTEQDERSAGDKLRAFLGNRWTVLFCRVSLGLMFMVAAYFKIIEPKEFAESIFNYRIMPEWTLHPMAIVLPWIEMIAGAFLVLGIWVRGSAFVINSLLVIFMIAITQALLRGIDLNCGCFGKGDNASGLETIFRDLGMLALGLVAMLYHKGELSLTGMLVAGKAEDSEK